MKNTLLALLLVVLVASGFTGPVEPELQQQPTVSVARDGAEVTFVVSHPDGLRHVDWKNLQVIADGQDLTTEFRTSLRSEYTTVSVNREITSLTVNASWAPGGPAAGREPCRVGVPCSPAPQLLRNASGYPDSQWTDGELPLAIRGAGSVWELLAVPYLPMQGRTLTKFFGVATDVIDDSLMNNWPHISWTLNVFTADGQYPTALDAFDDDARNGNFINNMPLSESHVPFGMDLDSYVTWIPSGTVSLSAGTEYWISVKGYWNGGGATTIPGIRHSTLGNLPTDWRRYSLSPVDSFASLGLVPGTAALDFEGY